MLPYIDCGVRFYLAHKHTCHSSDKKVAWLEGTGLVRVVVDTCNNQLTLSHSLMDFTS